MKRKIKWIALSMLSAGMLGVSATGVLTSKQVAAETAPTIQNVDISSFVMEKGAGVRVSGDGLRFSAEMDKTTYEDLEAKGASYGMLIVPENYLTEGYELTEANVFINNKFYFEEENPNDGRRGMINLTAEKLIDKDGDNKVEIYGAMTDIGTANIYREFVGVAYVQVPTAFDQTTGEPTAYEYKFAQYFEGDMANNTRSMYYTAQRTLELTDWDGDKDAVEANYITAYDTYIADFGYTFGYTEKHVLTKLDGSTETLSEELKYAALNSEVSATYYNDPALYSMYYCTDSEMPTSKVYANGKTTLEVSYKEVDVDLNDMRWSAEFTESNYENMLVATEWGTNTTEEPYSVTTAIPEGGVAGAYLYYSGAADKARADIQIQLDPMYSKGYYQALLNTGLPFVVKYDVYVENTNASYTTTSTKLKLWNGTASFNSSAGNTVTIGQWKTVSFDLSYLVNNWGNYRVFGLELQSYADNNQKVNFYLGNIRIEEKPKVYAYSNDASLAKNYSYSTAKNASISVATDPEGKTGKFIKVGQSQGIEETRIRLKTAYAKSYYELLLKDTSRKFQVAFDVYFYKIKKDTNDIDGDGNTSEYIMDNLVTSGTITPKIWKSATSFASGTAVALNTWHTYTYDLSTLVNNWNDTYGPLLVGCTTTTNQNPRTYFYVGNIRLIEVAA
ncbi:MAG: hypothetical protein J6A63_05555 [Clostridia bacterium]|nr:hypothetical protein [Clostridia bacterium]